MVITRQDYIDFSTGSMNEERRLLIEQYLSDNPLEKKALEAVVAHKDSGNVDAILQRIDDKIDQKIDSRTRVIEAPKQMDKGRIIPIKLLMTAASIAAIGVLLFFMFPSTSQSSYSFDAYFDRYPDVLTNNVRGATSGINVVNIHKGMEAYNNGDFSTASTLLSSVKEGKESHDLTQFYSAIAYLGSGDPTSCKEILRQMSTKTFPYSDGIQWYLAISYIELGEIDEAKVLLEGIIHSDHYKKQQAHELLAVL